MAKAIIAAKNKGIAEFDDWLATQKWSAMQTQPLKDTGMSCGGCV
jgi:hypothetical protein